MKTIHRMRYYKPMEIAKLGLIQSSSGSNNVRGNYNFILSMIKTGRLRAVDYSTVGGKPYFMVPQIEIERFHDRQLYKIRGGRDVKHNKVRKQKSKARPKAAAEKGKS